MNYKSYEISEVIYLHDEEPGYKYAITKNNRICGGANSIEEAKERIDDERGIINYDED